jgi:hypothetical protein
MNHTNITLYYYLLLQHTVWHVTVRHLLPPLRLFLNFLVFFLLFVLVFLRIRLPPLFDVPVTAGDFTGVSCVPVPAGDFTGVPLKP